MNTQTNTQKQRHTRKYNTKKRKATCYALMARITLWTFAVVFAYLIGTITPTEWNTVYAIKTDIINKTTTTTEQIFYYPNKDEIVNEIIDQARNAGVSVSTVLSIADCESRFQPFATNKNKNGTKDLGIFQINTIHGLSEQDSFDYKKNIAWAINEIKENGTGAWYSSEHCWK